MKFISNKIWLAGLCLSLLVVTWLIIWQINFITNHPDDYKDNGLPPVWDYHYWPLVGR